MILAALALSAAVAPAERWLHVGGRAGEDNEYVDTLSIKRNGDSVIIWTRRDLVPDGGTVWNELEFNCRRRTEAILAFVKDDGSAISHNEVRPHRPALPIAAGSISEGIFNILCS